MWIIPIILFLTIFSWIVYGFIKAKIDERKDLILFKNYSGKFKGLLEEARTYLKAHYPSPSYTLYVYVGEDGDRPSYVGTGFEGLFVVLNERQLENLSWMRDYNVIARAWGIKEMTCERDQCLFIYFHEHRHILQNTGFAGYLHQLPRTALPDGELWDRLNTPEEADASWFALMRVWECNINV